MKTKQDYLPSKGGASSKQNTSFDDYLLIAWNYILTRILRREEVYTLLFFAFAIGFSYCRLMYNAKESFATKGTLELLVLASLTFSVIAHLININKFKDSSKKQEQQLKNYIDYNIKAHKDRWTQA